MNQNNYTTAINVCGQGVAVDVSTLDGTVTAEISATAFLGVRCAVNIDSAYAEGNTNEVALRRLTQLCNKVGKEREAGEEQLMFRRKLVGKAVYSKK